MYKIIFILVFLGMTCNGDSTGNDWRSQGFYRPRRNNPSQNQAQNYNQNTQPFGYQNVQRQNFGSSYNQNQNPQNANKQNVKNAFGFNSFQTQTGLNTNSQTYQEPQKLFGSNSQTQNVFRSSFHQDTLKNPFENQVDSRNSFGATFRQNQGPFATNFVQNAFPYQTSNNRQSIFKGPEYLPPLSTRPPYTAPTYLPPKTTRPFTTYRPYTTQRTTRNYYNGTTLITDYRTTRKQYTTTTNRPTLTTRRFYSIPTLRPLTTVTPAFLPAMAMKVPPEPEDEPTTTKPIFSMGRGDAEPAMAMSVPPEPEDDPTTTSTTPSTTTTSTTPSTTTISTTPSTTTTSTTPSTTTTSTTPSTTTISTTPSTTTTSTTPSTTTTSTTPSTTIISTTPSTTTTSTTTTTSRPKIVDLPPAMAIPVPPEPEDDPTTTISTTSTSTTPSTTTISTTTSSTTPSITTPDFNRFREDNEITTTTKKIITTTTQEPFKAPMYLPPKENKVPIPSPAMAMPVPPEPEEDPTPLITTTTTISTTTPEPTLTTPIDRFLEDITTTRRPNPRPPAAPAMAMAVPPEPEDEPTPPLTTPTTTTPTTTTITTPTTTTTTTPTTTTTTTPSTTTTTPTTTTTTTPSTTTPTTTTTTTPITTTTTTPTTPTTTPTTTTLTPTTTKRLPPPACRCRNRTTTTKTTTPLTTTTPEPVTTPTTTPEPVTTPKVDRYTAPEYLPPKEVVSVPPKPALAMPVPPECDPSDPTTYPAVIERPDDPCGFLVPLENSTTTTTTTTRKPRTTTTTTTRKPTTTTTTTTSKPTTRPPEDDTTPNRDRFLEEVMTPPPFRGPQYLPPESPICVPDVKKRLRRSAKTLELGEVTGARPVWHVGIYKKTTIPYMQICGGSVLRQDVVISAAHCFWIDLGPDSPENYAVGANKVYKPYGEAMDKRAQKSDVRQIILPPRYRGSLTSFQDDLAILKLVTPFTYARGLRPVCLDFDDDFDEQQLANGNKGTVAGWGYTDSEGSKTQYLLWLELPYIDIETCIQRNEGFVRYITSDKVCAGEFNTGKALCKGDSGGGLVFWHGEPSNAVPYLRGIASTAPSADNLKCNVLAAGSFTRINAHRRFLRKHLPGIDQDCKYNAWNK